jgi:hypothetical protein
LPAVPIDAAAVARQRVALAALPAPEGADAAAFAALRASFEALLTGTAKGVRKLPSGERNVIEDLGISGDGSGGFILAWNYRNSGDYNGDSLVNISDLSPLGRHLNKSTKSPDWDEARLADGDENGSITISDLTPIGAALLSEVRGYNIYSGSSATGPWTLVDQLEFAEGSGTPRRYEFAIVAPAAEYYTVAPYDATGADAISSLSVLAAPPGATAQLGDTTEVAQQVVSPDGGTLQGAAGTPLEGVSLTIPAGAVLADLDVSLGYNSGTVTPVDGTVASPIIDITTNFNGTEGFAVPLEITTPYTAAPDEYPVPYYINEDGSGLELCEIVNVDEVAKTITFSLWHASSVVVFAAKLANPSAENFDTGFDPAINGFDSLSSLQGEMGAAAFMIWHYRKYHSPFKHRYLQTIPPGGLTGQALIAARAQAAVRGFKAYAGTAAWQRENMTDQQQWGLIRSTLRNSGGPILVDPIGGQQAPKNLPVVVYAFVGNEAYAHLPSGFDQVLKYNPETQQLTLGNYDYTQFICLGSGSMAHREPFAGILEDALNAFQGSSDATIELTGVQSGDEISLSPYPLSGTVQSGHFLITKLRVFVNGVSYAQDLTPDGTFNFSIPLENGDNYLYFRAEAASELFHSLLDIKHNYTNSPLLLTAEGVSNEPKFKYTIESIVKPEDPNSVEGEFDLWAKARHNGNEVFFDPRSPHLLPTGSGLLDANTFIIAAGDTQTFSPYFRVRRKDPQPGDPHVAYVLTKIHNPNHPDPQWHVLETEFSILWSDPLGTDPHWEDPGFVAGWSSIQGPMTWWE